VVGQFERRCQGKVRRIEERLVLCIISHSWMRSASSNQDFESRGRIIIDIDREIKGVRDPTLGKRSIIEEGLENVESHYLPLFGRIV
jgi:hypothetical protein